MSSNRVIFITGSTKGIGKAIADKSLELDYQVIASSDSEFSDRDVRELFGDNNRLDYLKCDISKLDDIQNAREYILNKYGMLDYLVCNAGVLPLPCGIEDITTENVDRTIDVNLKGTFWCLKELGGLIEETAEKGSIVNISSVDGIIGEPYGVIYSATKAGIISLTKSFARYFKEPLVRVNAVAPGLIDTPLTQSTGEDPSWTTDLSVIPRMGTPEEIADSVIYLLSDNSSFITGQILSVDGGFTLK